MLKSCFNNILGGGQLLKASHRLCFRLNFGFTLAEVLITLLVIGIVAAMVLPNILVKINEKVEAVQVKVFTSKMVKGLNLLNLEGGIHNNYSSTEDFVKALSKHLKMSQICGASNLGDCFPYKSIKYEKKNGEQQMNVSSITNARILNLEGGFEDTAAFILADGTPVIVSYDKTCISRDGNYREIHPCLAGLYDINGSRRPNKTGTKILQYHKITNTGGDIKGFNGANLGCMFKIGSLCVITTIFTPEESTYTCEERREKLNITYCGMSLRNNCLTSAIEICKNAGGRLPTMNELENAFASVLYGEASGHSKINYTNTWDTDILEALNAPNLTGFGLYSHNLTGIATGMWVYPKRKKWDWASQVTPHRGFCVKD